MEMVAEAGLPTHSRRSGLRNGRTDDGTRRGTLFEKIARSAGGIRRVTAGENARPPGLPKKVPNH
jgi:hypothetical protein